MQLTSTAFQEGEPIPKKCTGDDANVSPPLSWSGAPSATKSFALICDDPDAPRGTWTHWVLYNLPADKHELEEGVPTKETLSSGAKQGKNSSNSIGYSGPAPPAGKPHHYHFKVYALDTTLDLATPTKDQLEKAIKGHVLAHGELIGTYER